MWRLREKGKDKKEYSLKEVRLAIMMEVGTDERTLISNINKLQEVGQLRRKNRWLFIDEGQLL